MSGDDQRAASDLAAADIDLDSVALSHAELLGGGEAHQHSVVPAQVRDLLGQLLQPAIVREAAVVERGIGPEENLDSTLRGLLTGGDPSSRGSRGHNGSSRRRRRLRREGCAIDPAIVQRLTPRGVEVALDISLRVGLDNLEGSHLRVVEQRLQHLVRAVAAVQRRDHRLDDRDSAVIATGIRPALEVVRLVDVPLANSAGFVDVHAKVNRVRHFGKGARELEVRGRGVQRVDAEHDQPLHLAGVDVGDERLQVIDLLAG